MTLFILIVGTSSLLSQKSNSNEILVDLKPNTINVGLNLKDSFGLDSTNVKSKAFLSTLKKLKIFNIKRAYSGFNLADTVRYTKDRKSIKMLNLSWLYKIELPPNSVADSVMSTLRNSSDVIFSEKNGGWQLYTNDQHYGKQWYLKNTGQSGGTVGADIKAEDAWQIFTGSSQVKIGIIDSGVKTDQEDLSGKSSGDLPDYNWHDPYFYNSYTHGTHVAGIASAKTNNGPGIAGVDQNAQIYSKRIFDSQNHQNDNVFIYNAIVDAVNQNCSILNNSWGGPNYSFVVRSAFSYAYKMNRVAVVAMDDKGATGPTYPADYGQGIISVGATTATDNRASYSQAASWIDVSAPGGSGAGDPFDIFSTVAYYNASYGGYYDYLAGTSMATPIVTGIASLLKGYNSNLDNDDIEHIIQLSADKVPGMNGQNYTNEYGYGRVNAKKALDLLRYPYSFNQLSASGGTDYYKGPAFYLNTYGASGLPDGNHIAYRHEVRKTIYFSSLTNPNIWGRGVATTGWSAANSNYGMGYCNVVPGTVTNNSATIYTYVYEVYSLSGGFLGWYPTTPSNVQFGYSTLGVPAPLSASISGNTYLNSGQNGTWTANPSGGYQPYTYDWYLLYPGTLPKTASINKPPAGYWIMMQDHSQQITRYDDQDFELKCVVTDNQNNNATSNIIYVTVDGGLARTTASLPTENKLEQNNPNPFNPTTLINYSIKKEGFVKIKVYDVLGREIATLVNEDKPAGFYTANFDASRLSSGVYFYTIKTNEFFDRKKMIVMK